MYSNLLFKKRNFKNGHNTVTVLSTLGVRSPAPVRAHHKYSRRATNRTRETALTYNKNLPNNVKLTK